MSTIEEVAALLTGARRVVLVPGYGVAVAQAHHALANLAGVLERRGPAVEFALHPVAGRVPGQLDALLDAAGVPWSARRDLDTATFDAGSIALVVGANDVVNPALAMPVLEVARAGSVVVFLDATGPGFAGVANPLFAGATVIRGDALDLVRETEQAVTRITQPRDDVAELVEPVVQPGHHDRY
ncbi:MAG TPA: NAD(P)(+) transhydrogenase (Re/Si-specific) subunit beta [Sporichthya sp.]|nr:NAD(P)(+) transhydrogenase (Re/Si-specific) subunit beta [Sporichthya sp.]